MDGWIKLHRKMSENIFWTCEKFSRGQAWVDLLMLANHTENFFYVRGHKITVLRGQVGWSQLQLSTRWKWSRNKVRKFLNDLEKEHQIEQQISKSYSIITIINYDKYQEKGQQLKQQKDNRKTTEGQQKDTNKNDKKEKKYKKKNNTPLPPKEKIEYPGWLNLKLWDEFKDHRKSLKSPMSILAEKKAITELNKLLSGGGVQEEIINQSIVNGWKGIFQTNGRRLSGTSPRRSNRDAANIQACEDFINE